MCVHLYKYIHVHRHIYKLNIYAIQIFIYLSYGSSLNWQDLQIITQLSATLLSSLTLLSCFFSDADLGLPPIYSSVFVPLITGYMCEKLTRTLGCQAWSIFLFSTMKISLKKPHSPMSI